MQAIKEILGRSDERKNLWNVISTMSVVVVMIVSIFAITGLKWLFGTGPDIDRTVIEVATAP